MRRRSCSGFNSHNLVMPLRKRLNDAFAGLARRHGTRTVQGVLLLPELGQEALAEMIGGSRPMVSKMVTEVTAEGVRAAITICSTGNREKPNAVRTRVLRSITSARALRTGSRRGDAVG